MASSSAEVRYTLEGVHLGLREDGRDLLDYRYSSLDVGVLPQASGSCRVRGGSAEVLVGIVAALAKPDVSSPKLGRITVTVGGGPGDTVFACLPQYEALTQGALDAEGKRLWLESALGQLCTSASIPDALRTLCILPGQQCWELKAHVQLLRADGCPLDAAALALRGALNNTRVPKAALQASGTADLIDGGDDGTATATKTAAKPASGGRLDLDLDESLDESLPFDARPLPLYVTLASLDGRLVADCTAKERRAAGSALSLALDAEGNVLALCGGGGFGLHLATLAPTLAACRALGTELHAAAADALAQAAEAAEQRGGAAACFSLH